MQLAELFFSAASKRFQLILLDYSYIIAIDTSCRLWVKEIVWQGIIESNILMIRGHKVMLDKFLAELYGVPTKRLNEPVRRNIGSFPDDFMFQLNKQEASSLRTQNATLK